jgi:hypothetical protein
MVVSSRANGDLATKAYANLRSNIDNYVNAADALMTLKYSNPQDAAAKALLDFKKGTLTNIIAWPPLTPYVDLDNKQAVPFENPEEAKEIVGKAVLKLKEQGKFELPDAVSKEAPSKVYEHLTIQRQIHKPARFVYPDRSSLIMFAVLYNGDPKWQRGHSVFNVLDSDGKSTLVEMHPHNMLN